MNLIFKTFNMSGEQPGTFVADRWMNRISFKTEQDLKVY